MKEKGTPTDGTFWICPLYTFKCTAQGLDYIDLGGEVTICRMSHTLCHRLDERIAELALDVNEVEWVIQLPYNPRTKANPEIAIDTDLEALKAANRARLSHEFSLLHDSKEIAIDLITALRLQHKGDVAPGPLLQLNIINGEFALGGITCWFPLSKSGDYFVFAKEEYQLLETEVDTLREFWQDFQDKRRKDKLKDLKIALRRFNSSYGEGFEDRLLDQIIALESLYLGDDKELGYKLALRAAFLLAEGERERKQIFKRLKEAYRARGTIVHGGERPSKLEELVVDTEEYLRQSIKHFIRLSAKYALTKECKNTILDQNILVAGRLLRA